MLNCNNETTNNTTTPCINRQILYYWHSKFVSNSRYTTIIHSTQLTIHAQLHGHDIRKRWGGLSETQIIRIGKRACISLWNFLFLLNLRKNLYFELHLIQENTDNMIILSSLDIDQYLNIFLILLHIWPCWFLARNAKHDAI